MRETTLLYRIIEREIPQKFKKPLPVFDALLQFSQNPTSASAGYGIEENYSYIEMNLAKRYQLTRDYLAKITKFVKQIWKRMEKINYDVYLWRNELKKVILEREKDLFVSWYTSTFEKLDEANRKKFIFFLLSLEKQNLLEKFWCFFDKEESVKKTDLNNILIRWGLGNPLFYRSSSGHEETEFVLSPFLSVLREKLKEELYVSEKNVEAFFSKLSVNDIKLLEKCIINDGILNCREGKCLLEEPSLVESSRSFWAIWPPAINEFKQLIVWKKRDETSNIAKALGSILSSFANANFPFASVRSVFEIDGAYAWHIDFASQPTKPPIRVDILLAPWLFPLDNYRDILNEFLSKSILPDLVFLFFMHENLPTLSNKLSAMGSLQKWFVFIQTPDEEFYPLEFGDIRKEVKDVANEFLIAFLPYFFKELKISNKWKSPVTEKMEIYALLKENTQVLEILLEGLNSQPIVTNFLRNSLRRKFGGSTGKWKEIMIQRNIFGEKRLKKWENQSKRRLHRKDFLDGATFGEVIGIFERLPELLEEIPTNKELLLSSLNILNKWRKELWGHPLQEVAKIQLNKEQYEGIKRALKNVREILQAMSY